MTGNDLGGAKPLQGSSVTVVSAPSNGAVAIHPIDGPILHSGYVGSDFIKFAICRAPHHCAIRPM